MTRTTELNDNELAAVSGGVTSFIGNSIPKPHIPRDKDLLTPSQIAKILAPLSGFNPPVING